MRAFLILVFAALALGPVTIGSSPTVPAASHSTPLAPALTATPTPCVSASWSAQAAYPLAIADHAVAGQGGNIYSFGGIVNNAMVSNAYKYPPPSACTATM